jgi:hypothetical protein
MKAQVFLSSGLRIIKPNISLSLIIVYIIYNLLTSFFIINSKPVKKTNKILKYFDFQIRDAQKLKKKKYIFCQ